MNARLSRDVLEFKRMLNAAEMSPVDRYLRDLACGELAQALPDDGVYKDYLTPRARTTSHGRLESGNACLTETFAMEPFPGIPQDDPKARSPYPGLSPERAALLAEGYARISRERPLSHRAPSAPGATVHPAADAQAFLDPSFRAFPVARTQAIAINFRARSGDQPNVSQRPSMKPLRLLSKWTSAAGRSGTRVRFVGNHRRYHCGSAAVAEYILGTLAEHGLTVSKRDYDILLVNGEGSMCLGCIPFHEKMQQIRTAMKEGKRVHLVNTVWQQNPYDYDDLLPKLGSVVTREVLSQRDLRAVHGIDSRVFVDFSLFAPLRPTDNVPDHAGKIVMTDFAEAAVARVYPVPLRRIFLRRYARRRLVEFRIGSQDRKPAGHRSSPWRVRRHKGAGAVRSDARQFPQDRGPARLGKYSDTAGSFP